MSIDAESLDVVHHTGAERFEIRVGKHVAVLEYVMREQKMVFTHTGVPKPLEAQGIGSRLARAGLEYAREKSYKVVPACEFMEVYIRRHREYRDMVSR
jgi:predicted GNAT family acetyltransferase